MAVIENKAMIKNSSFMMFSLPYKYSSLLWIILSLKNRIFISSRKNHGKKGVHFEKSVSSFVKDTNVYISRMGKYFIFLVIVFSSVDVCAQSITLNDLLKNLEHSKEDTNKVSLLLDIEKKYFTTDLDSALYYNHICEVLISKINANQMENLIKMVSEKTGISETQATTAVQTVVSFLKDKMPAGIGTQVESFIKGGTGSIGGIAGNLKDKVGGMFGK